MTAAETHSHGCVCVECEEQTMRRVQASHASRVRELMACPFCGSHRHPIMSMTSARRYKVRCRCNAKGPTAATADEAIAAWNRRVS